MAIWYRVSLNESTKVTFSGEGGLHVPGRWNYLGRKVVYCSASIALCTLEWLSHNGLSVAGFNYYRYSIDIPSDLTIKFFPTDLPKNWHLTPATNLSRDFAESYLFSSSKTLAIIVPSVIVPEEFNLIMNPLHLEFSRIMKTVKKLGQFIAPKR
jgi:RES domain-containing protein